MTTTKACPICGKVFPRPRDLSNAQWNERQYCSRRCAHISLQRRKTMICARCGKAFEVQSSSKRKYCCRTCSYPSDLPPRARAPEAQAKAGRSRSATFRARQDTRLCEYCGEPFGVRRKSARKFCCRRCKDRWWSEHRLETVACPGCGREFQRSHSNVRARKYCSRACYLQHLSGVDNPNWQGGPCYYGPHWDRIAEEVRVRDGVCHDCGKTPDANGVALDVHHIIPLREFHGDFDKANDPSNLVALCKSCHRKYQERDY